jgi:twitching motility protein PilI
VIDLPEIAALNPFEILLDYEKRSLAHVAGLPEQLDAPGLWRGIAYRLGDAFLVSSIGEVNEILMFPAITPVPGTKAWMLGIANVRGNLVTVVHLRGFLEGEPFRVTERTRVLVVRQATGATGLVVDEVLGQRSFVDEQLRGIDVYADSPVGRFIENEYRVGQSVWGIFSMSELMRAPDFMQAAA